MVDTNQTFHRGSTAAVECNAFRGDPPTEILWVRHGQLVLQGLPRMRVDDAFQTLFIEDIGHSDTGIYQCILNTIRGPIIANISVNVIGPMLHSVEVTNLPHNLTLAYGHSLRLECRVSQAHPKYIIIGISWLNNSNAQVSNSNLLELAPGEVYNGFYRCLVYGALDLLVQRSVEVTVNAPPVPLRPRPNSQFTITTREQRSWVYVLLFKFQLDRSNVSVGWKKLDNGRLVDFHFGSRVSFRVSEKYVVLSARYARLADIGQYQLNVSNQYGYAEFGVMIDVRNPRDRGYRDVPQMQPAFGIVPNLDGTSGTIILRRK